MEGNMKELLQTILYLGGIMYSIIYGLQKLKSKILHVQRTRLIL